MHLHLISLAVGASCLARLMLFRPSQSIRWQYMLGLFLFPPLLVLVTAIAILNMGQGHMLGLPVGQIGQLCAVWTAGDCWANLNLAGIPGLAVAAAGAAILNAAAGRR